MGELGSGKVLLAGPGGHTQGPLALPGQQRQGRQGVRLGDFEPYLELI